MSSGTFLTPFQLAYGVSPIVLAGGIAALVPGNLLPIVAITEALDISAGVLTGGSIPSSLDEFFAQFVPLPGATLISNSVGKYPFANQAVAANAIIQNPRQISMLMIAPVRETGGYFTKPAIFSALQAALQTHNSLGGLYHVATPAGIWDNCVMLDVTDVTDGESKQRQTMWQFDFERPLVTSNQAQTSLNSLMSKMANGSQILGNPTWSGTAAAVGSPFASAGSPLAAALDSSANSVSSGGLTFGPMFTQ